jgi:hypothetical protein
MTQNGHSLLVFQDYSGLHKLRLFSLNFSVALPSEIYGQDDIETPVFGSSFYLGFIGIPGIPSTS